VLAAGGSGGSSAQLYDPVSGLWSSTGPLITGRYSHTAVLLASGRVLAAAGRRTSGTIALNSAEEYWPAVGSWAAAGDRIFAHGFQAP